MEFQMIEQSAFDEMKTLVTTLRERALQTSSAVSQRRGCGGENSSRNRSARSRKVVTSVFISSKALC